MRSPGTRRVTARYQWDRLRVSFWFAPVIMSLGAILLAWVMYRIDASVPNVTLESSRLVLAGTPNELRSNLIGMATTILATAGVVFTLLTLPLSTVAAQYGSRLLRIFQGDRTTQFVLGMFVATFIYCLTAALSIPPAVLEQEGPLLTATVGLLLMLGTFASLVVLVQHISSMLQAPNIAAAAGAEARAVILADIPEAIRGNAGAVSDLEAQSDLRDAEGYPVHSGQTGYIEFVDPETVVSLAIESDLVIRLLRKPGRFVRREEVMALVWPASRVNEVLEAQIRHTFRIGNTRKPTQDILYAVNQLAEMAVRAMSPAINDPFTAMTCLDYLGEGLALFIRQGVRDPCYYDLKGHLRLVLEPVTLDELLSAAFDMLRHASCDNARVLQHMLGVIDGISQETASSEVRQKLLEQIKLIEAESQAGAIIEQDRQSIRYSVESLQRKLNTDDSILK